MNKQEYIMLMRIAQKELFSKKSGEKKIIAIQTKIREYFYTNNHKSEWPTDEEINYIYSSEEELK